MVYKLINLADSEFSDSAQAIRLRALRKILSHARDNRAD